MTFEVVRTPPSWTLRLIALVFAALAIYVVSPWFTPPSLSYPLLRSDLGQWLFFIFLALLAILLWMLSTRRRTDPHFRWYHE
jgi:hypothetical protein